MVAAVTPKAVEIKFPLGGLSRRGGYQSQEEATTPDALNVRPFGTLEGRQRGGSRPGLEKASSTQLPATPQMLASVVYINASGARTYSLILASNTSFYQDVSGTLTALSGAIQTEAGDNLIAEDGTTEIDLGTPTVSATATIRAVERGQKLYVADYGTVLQEGTDAAITTGNTLTAAGTDFTAQSIDINRDVCVVWPRNGSTVASAVYAMVTLANGSVTLNPTGLVNGDCSYKILPGVKEFDPFTGTLRMLIPTAGVIPTGCPHIARYRDRLVLAGPDHIWYMSRQGDPFDWNYGADPDDTGRAIASTNAEAGRVGQPITALIPHSDDYLIFGGESSMWILSGDPAFGGQLDNLSQELGVVNGDAWCRLPDSSTLFLARSGLYVIPPGGQGYPVAFSKELVPRELLDVDASSYISMAYDSREDGVHLSITPTAGTAGDHWWIDWRSKTLWPVAYKTNTMQPAMMLPYAGTTSADRQVYLASLDGYLRRYTSDLGSDDGTAIESYVVLGPYRLGQDGFTEGILTELMGTLDTFSASVDWSITVADTAEGAVADIGEPQADGIWTKGRSNIDHPRLRGGAAAIKVGATGKARWAMEGLSLKTRPVGRQRV